MLHFMGIGGVGMAGVAALMKARGCEVTGCDLYRTARTEWLESIGIPVATGHSPGHLAGTHSLVATPAVPENSPELAAARKAGIPVRYRGEVLAGIVSGCDSVAVCGTHGKTTTSLFTTRLLQALGADPSWCIGSETGRMPVAGVGAGALVVEADESDGTLVLYHPDTLVLNAVDFDHLEHFASPEAYFDCYRQAIRNTRRLVIVCKDHPKAFELARLAPAVRTFGLSGDADVSARDWPEVAAAFGGAAIAHNIKNALAAVAVALSRGYSREEIVRALPAALAQLPDRRFECVRREGDIRVYTDYAHHPAEIKCAIEMARRAANGAGAVRVVFEPHRYSRTKALLAEFPPALAGADELVLAPVYPAFEEPVPGGDIADLYAACRREHLEKKVMLARSLEEAWRHMRIVSVPGDVVLLLGAGTIGDLAKKVAETPEGECFASSGRRMASLAGYSFFRTGGASCGGGVKIPVGMGSNLWISDLATDAEYVRPRGNAAMPGARFIADKPHLNFMRGIPGTLGGWVKMNAGAFGHSIGEFVKAVRLADGRRLSAAECRFGYRHSAIDGMIEDVEFLEGPFPETPVPVRKTFPPRCCGSVFKNPPGASAGRLLEEAGAKEMAVGGAKVWREHANVIYAGDGANSSDILALSRLMALAVYFRTGIRLEPEIAGIG